MKSCFVTGIFSLFVFHACAQGMFGVEAGMGKSTGGSKDYATPALQGYYLTKCSRTIYLGASLAYERYSLSENYGAPPGGFSNESILSIRQKSGYVFASPMLDVGIGYRKYIHVRASFGAGVLADGSQSVARYEQYVAAPPRSVGYDTATYASSYNMRTLISRYTLGVSERIPTGGYWNVVVTEQFSYIPSNLSSAAAPLQTNYFLLTVGVMHKYPMVAVEY